MAWYRRRSADDTDGLMDLAAASRWRCPTGIKTEGLTKTPDARRRSRLVRGENWPCRWCITSTCPSQETDRLAGEKSIFNIPIPQKRIFNIPQRLAREKSIFNIPEESINTSEDSIFNISEESIFSLQHSLKNGMRK